MRLDVLFDFSWIDGLEDVILIRCTQALALWRCKLLAVRGQHLDVNHVAAFRLF